MDPPSHRLLTDRTKAMSLAIIRQPRIFLTGFSSLHLGVVQGRDPGPELIGVACVPVFGMTLNAERMLLLDPPAGYRCTETGA
jgi:hypothetical protein